MGVLRRELSDQQVLDYPIIANGNCTARHHELSPIASPCRRPRRSTARAV